MTLQASGKIKMTEVNLELKIIEPIRIATTPISLGEPAVRVLGKKPNGKISMSDLYGKRSYTPTLRVENFYSGSAPWVAPAGVTKIDMTGYGGDGYYSPPTPILEYNSITSMYLTVVDGLFGVVGPGGLITPGNFTWDAAYGHSQQVLASITQGATVYDYWQVTQYNDGYTFKSEGRNIQHNGYDLYGPAESNNYPFWYTSGPIMPVLGEQTVNLHDVLSYRLFKGYNNDGGTNIGGNVYMFGLMFPGYGRNGVSSPDGALNGSLPASRVDFFDFPVTPGTSYPITFEQPGRGGSVQIRYYL